MQHIFQIFHLNIKQHKKNLLTICYTFFVSKLKQKTVTTVSVGFCIRPRNKGEKKWTTYCSQEIINFFNNFRKTHMNDFNTSRYRVKYLYIWIIKKSSRVKWECNKKNTPNTLKALMYAMKWFSLWKNITLILLKGGERHKYTYT